MKIVHVLNNRAVEKDVAGEGKEFSFFLSNDSGGFAHFAAATAPTSKYQGMFTKIGGSLFKVIESINTVPGEKIAAVENRGYSAIFHHSSFYESFFMPLRKNCLVYQLSRKMPIELFLDVMAANDFREWGRHYRSYDREGVLVVEFMKKTNSREGGSGEIAEFSVFVAVMHDGFVNSSNGGWVKRSYRLDAGRNSASERYVYRAAKVVAKTLVISVAASEAAAIKESEIVFKSLDGLKKAGKMHCDGLCSSSADGEFAFAADAARIALDKLKNAEGLYAGLPWFFQHWTRDELVSCTALPISAKKSVILDCLNRILDDGRLPAMIGDGSDSSAPKSADSVGWLFKRAAELIEKKAFSAAEIRKVKAALKRAIDGILKSRFRDGFIHNSSKETWMDTDFNSDGRKGACIEIQAMQLQMYRLMHKLSKNKTYLLLENSLRKNVRKFFWNGFALADRLNDYTARPNLLIAAYVYPQLLSKNEWETCITRAIEKLWLGWGGLATIDKSHPNFCSEYTGETNQSYHNGDSWFWINNIAAIVMAKINNRKFKSYVEKIAAASASDILWKGAVGCASELSSAKEQRAEGCLNQAWSDATFIELIRNLRGHD